MSNVEPTPDRKRSADESLHPDPERSPATINKPASKPEAQSSDEPPKTTESVEWLKNYFETGREQGKRDRGREHAEYMSSTTPEQRKEREDAIEASKDRTTKEELDRTMEYVRDQHRKAAEEESSGDEEWAPDDPRRQRLPSEESDVSFASQLECPPRLNDERDGEDGKEG